ncbi:MAG: response regulator [Deltaproteobacteria bacterium]
MNILIAEDDAITLRRLQHFLEKWDHHVTTAANGVEALEKFLDQDVELVITDWMMPEMDGMELVRQIRSGGRDKPYVYTILLTSKGEKEDVVKGLSEVGVDDYVVKPFEPDELRARLSVGERTVRLERTLREYGKGLEKIVRMQTRLIRKTQEETIIRLLTALESRDEETGGHVRRIGLFSAHLAEAAGWTQEEVEDIRLAAPMHDIGKIGVPDAILRKEGPLTTDEFEVIKSHTTIGGQILGDSEFPMLQMAHEIALYHHERFDGGGYPEDRNGEDIPVAARIVALVDVYDALSQDRVYRKACPLEEVLESMRKSRGSHFDPDLFDLFLEAIPDFRRIAAKNP